MEVFATALSPAKETLMNIDVFGRIYDANGANALDRVRIDLSSHLFNLHVPIPTCA